jgi:hypothetical protein
MTIVRSGDAVVWQVEGSNEGEENLRLHCGGDGWPQLGGRLWIVYGLYWSTSSQIVSLEYAERRSIIHPGMRENGLSVNLTRETWL